MMIQELFPPVEDQSLVTLHSGGARGSDTKFEDEAQKRGFVVRAYSYKTTYHKSPNKVEISQEDFMEGIEWVGRCSKFLARPSPKKYLNLLARNWAQVKYSDQIFAVGAIVDPGQSFSKGYINRSRYQVVDGGTGWAVAGGILKGSSVFVYDQIIQKWHRWSSIHQKFLEIDPPKITSKNFAGIGTRNLNSQGEREIEQLFIRSYQNI